MAESARELSEDEVFSFLTVHPRPGNEGLLTSWMPGSSAIQQRSLVSTVRTRPFRIKVFGRAHTKMASRCSDDALGALMEESHYKVEVENDHLRRLCGASPVNAISELIWNCLDADATRVQVTALAGELDSSTVIVRDNGHGIPFPEARFLFVKLGGSWKGSALKSKQLGRALHGKEGKGRFKALALGRVVDWIVTYGAGEGLRRYAITMLADDPKDVRITGEVSVAEGEPGVEVRISEVNQRATSLQAEENLQEFTEIFAPYLTDYGDVQVTVFGAVLDPSISIASRTRYELAHIVVSETESYPATLDIVEWRKLAQHRTLYLCSSTGMPLRKVATRFHLPEFNFSGYLRSAYNEKLREYDENLDLADLHAPLVKAQEEALERIRAYAIERTAEKSQQIVEDWKRADVYPYKGEAVDPVEAIERQVFDIVALTVRRQIPELSGGNRKSQAWQLKLLRRAIERGPEDLQPLLLEVLDLPVKEQRELAQLLKEVTLLGMVRATKLITDRLKFVAGLSDLIFDTHTKRTLLERKQLHRLLAENTWFFGEEFNLSADDEGLTQVLRKHCELQKRDLIIDRPVRTSDGRRGVVDLMLSRSLTGHRSEDLDHLIVELKRPAVRITQKEIGQVQQYAFAVADDERFRHGIPTRWTFWVVSNDMDEVATRLASQSHLPPGQIFSSDQPRISIWVKTWAQILKDNESRLRFYQQNLDYKASKSSAVSYLREKYAKYLGSLDTDKLAPISFEDGLVSEEGDEGEDETAINEPT